VRLDRACAVSPVGDLSDEAVATLRSARAILVSDYGRGITGMPAIRDEVSRCATRSPLVWDPHPRGTIPVPGTAVATPNRDALARWPDLASETQDARAQEMIERWNIHSVAVTHGKRGAVLYTKGRAPFTVSARLVFGDVCGAGDCLAKTIAVKLANGSTVTAAVQAGVSVASAFVASGGASAVRIEPPEGRTGTL
jgi:bifunctional ADP-heptose synthase (sugar kinase/adenylyltransferase)